MRHGSLFSGIGGFDLAAEWMGWENVFHCEWNEFGQKVLKHHFPNADSYSDITKTDFTKYANKIDILTGGFPCQPFSIAGQRKGTDDERYLWHEMLRAIKEIKPKFVIAENVYGIINIDGGMVFESVCLDLEAEGYEVQPFIIPAAAKNAPHRRDRVWFIAYSSSNGGSENTKSKPRTNKQNKEQPKCLYNSGNAIENTMFSGCVHGGNEQEGADIWQQRNTCTGSTDGIYLQKGNATDTTSTRGRQNNGQRKSRLNDENGKRNNWQNFPTESPICGGDDGLPTELDGITFSKWRAESIKGYGNAIVPQVAFTIFKALCTIS